MMDTTGADHPRPVTQSKLIQQTNKQIFFHYTPEDDNFYLVTCKNILRGPILDNHVYDHEFFYSNSAANYYITCEYIPHSLIIDLLNKELCTRMDYDTTNLNRKEPLFLYQKFNLEQTLKQILPSRLMKHNIPERTDYDKNLHNLPTTQTNFDEFNDHNYDFANKTNAVGGYTRVANPQQRVDFNSNISQQIPRPDYNENTNHPFLENIATTAQEDSMIDSQTNFNNLHPQNEVESFQQTQIPEDDYYSQQQVNLDNFPQYHTPESIENVGNNVTAVVSMADINQNYDLPSNYHQDVYSHQRVESIDFPLHHIPETRLDYNDIDMLDGNNENDLVTTMAAPD
ncbi:hypothetical protein RclHR1_09040008 [Rhizophagus clarus]|uniref:Uncharacterized protein n=1 Tax=Rhizophagus clarus TaxID=94130 RepID=A0A2Z6SPM5_9GLOM|nr:hypothetical protein RclHR1_09040008 [Rhizophagus clarus]GES73832.1 hypothetical protein GLOIN_2v1588737 [Rhizophagus clarus]